MSVSWQPSQVQLGMGVGTTSTSSSDYGNWFQSRPALTFPSSSIIPRRNPTRKLGALSIGDGSLPYGESTHMAPIPDSTGPAGMPVFNNGLDQSGKVNSFLSKVNQESRVPRSPQIPDLLDLPGRIVRAPRTRHMTPRNSPDAEKHAETQLDAKSEMVAPFQSPRYNLERSHTMMDMTNRTTSSETVPYNPYGLTRSNTNLASTGHSLHQRASQPSAANYVIPNLQLERANTMTSFNPSHQSQTNNQPFSMGHADSHISPRNTLQRSHTTLDGSKFTPQPINPSEQHDNRLGWNFRRVPTFHGNLPGSNNNPNNGITHRQLETFQPSAPAEGQPSSLSRYMFSTMPTSNALKNQENDLKPRIPMYWLYGSRGRPGAREDPAYTPSTTRGDHIPQHLITPDGRIMVENGAFPQGGQQLQPSNGPASQNVNSESDFLSMGADRRDPYRSNYSSYTDQRTQSEPDKSEFDREAAAALETASLPDEQGRVKSILKKNPSGFAPPAFPTRAVPGKRLPHLSAIKKSGSKRVTFAL